METLENTGIKTEVIPPPARPIPKHLKVKSDTEIFDVESTPVIENTEPPALEINREELPHIANLTDGPRTIQGSNFIPEGLNLNDHLAILHDQIETESNEAPTLGRKNTKVLQTLDRMVKDQRKPVPDEKIPAPESAVEHSEWKIPAEAIKKLHELVSSASSQTEKIKLTTLIFDIEDRNHLSEEMVLGKISVNEGLSDEEKTELEALVKGEPVSSPEAENENHEAISAAGELAHILEVEKIGQPEPTQNVDTAVAPQETAEVLTEEELRENLTQAREEYARRSVAYKKVLREKKGLFRRTMSDLGFPGKQMPEPNTIKEFLQAFDAEEDYIQAKKQLRLKLAGQGEYKADKAMEQAEEEYGMLQQKIVEAMPPLEKGIVRKNFEKWAQWPLPARVALTTAFLTALGVGAGSIAVGGALGVGGYRVARGVVGGLSSQITGKYKDKKYKQEASERKREALENYAGVFDSEKFEEKERELMKFFEEEEIQKKRDRLKKAGWMMATGAGVSIGLGELSQAVSNLDVPSTSVHADDIKGTSEIEPVRVELSSKGFIDTFDNLKHDLAVKYPDVDQAPSEVQHILNSSPDKLAVEYGFYKPGQEFESAFGLKGDHLVLDKSGSLVLENAKGSQVIFDAKSGGAHEYSGRMLDAETGRISPDVPHSNLTITETPTETHTSVSTGETISQGHPETLTEMAANGALSTEYPDNAVSAKPFEYSIADAGLDTAVVASGMNTEKAQEKIPEDGKAPSDLFAWNGKTVAEVPHDFTSADLALGKLPMADRYQFGKEKADREAKRHYNIMFEKMAMQWPEGTVDYRLPIEYQGGRMQVLQKGENLTVLLNGEKLGSGTLVSGMPTFQYEGPKSTGMLGMKSDYELAFDAAQDVIKKKINLFIRKPN